MVFDAGTIEARLVLDRKQFQADLAASKREGADFEKNRFEATLGMRNNEAIAAVEKVEAIFDQLRTELQRDTPLHVDNSEAISQLLETEVVFQQLRGLLEQDIVVKPNVDLRNLSGLGNLGTNIDNVNVNVKLTGTQAGADGLRNVSHAADEAERSARRAYGAFGLLTTQVSLFAGLFGATHLIGSIQLWHIALDGVLETTILVTEATLALAETALVAAPGIESIYVHLKAVNEVSKALNQNIPPFNGNLAEMAHQFASLDVTALGGVLNLFGHSGGAFQQVTTEVGVGINNIIAKLDLWNAAQAHTGILAHDGAEALHQLAVVAGEVFIAFTNFAKADPGTLHYLLDVFIIAGKLVEGISELPAPILKAVIAVHSFILWGGLLTTLLSKMVPAFVVTQVKALATSLGLLGAAAKETAAVQAIPLVDLRKNVAAAEAETGRFSKAWGGLMGALLSPQGLVVAAAALGYYVWWTTQADAATKSFIASVEQTVNTSNAVDAIDAINASIAGLDKKMADVATDPNTKKLADQVLAVGYAVQDSQKQVQNGNPWGQLVDYAKIAFGALVNANDGAAISLAKAGNDIQAYQGEIVKLTNEQKNLFKEAYSLMDVHQVVSRVITANMAPALIKEGGLLKESTVATYTFSQALALMGLAGVRANDSFEVMQQKVKNLIAGWNDMSISGGILGQGINAIQLQSEIASSHIQDLTGAWDAFMKLVAGSETTFVSFEQSIATLDQSAQGITKTVTTYNAALGKNVTTTSHQIASINGLNDASLTLRQNWESSLSAAGQFYDALTLQAAAAGLGAKGNNLLARAGKDLIAQLLPLAKGSASATAQLYAFAQIAGYQGPNSMKQLVAWLGNTKNAEKDLNGITTQLTVSSADLIQDVQNLAGAINQDLNQAMAAALVQANGGQKAFDDFASAVLNAHGNISKMTGPAQTLANTLIHVLGNTKQAHAEFDTFAIQLGLTKGQADQLWQSLNKIPTSQVDTVKVIGNGYYSVTGASGQSFTISQGGLNSPHAMGGLITGGMPFAGNSGDNVLISAKTGEAVVPTSLVPKYAPSFAADGIPGFASGGLVGGYKGSLSGLGDWTLNNVNATNTMFSNAAVGSLEKAISQLAATIGPVNPSGYLGPGSANYAADITSVLNAMHLPLSLVPNWLRQIQTESGGNLGAVNLTDSNAQAGHPSVGLLQLIPATFAAYAGPYINTPPLVNHGGGFVSLNPMAQIYAAIHYAWARYDGSMASVIGQGHGYDAGGLVDPGITIVHNKTKRPEYILPADVTQALLEFARSGMTPAGRSGGPLIGAYHTNYYGTGDTAEAMRELLFTLRRVNQEV